MPSLNLLADQQSQGSTQLTDFGRTGFGEELGVEEIGDRLDDNVGEVASDLVIRSDSSPAWAPC